MAWRWYECAHTDTWDMQCDMDEMNWANCMRKLACEVYLSTHPVGYSGSLSTVNETNWKSGRSLTSPFLPDLFKVRYQCPWYLFKFLCGEMIRMVFFCKFVHLFALLFCPSDCELWYTINWISEKSIVNTWECSPWESTFLQHLFHAVQAMWYSFCSSVLPYRAPWQRPFLIT